jgi:large subunit ribosomal protein L11
MAARESDSPEKATVQRKQQSRESNSHGQERNHRSIQAGQHGVNPGQFIQRFNAASAHLKGKVIGCVVTVYKDRTFDIELKSPPAAELLKEAVKAEKGSGEPNKTKIGKVTMAQCKKIAEEKMKELNAFDLDHGALIIAGQARSMGITVEG